MVKCFLPAKRWPNKLTIISIRAKNWRLFHGSHCVTVEGVRHGFESGAYRVPADREQEFKSFLQKHAPVPCAGVIIRPPCNPAATRVKLELEWPPWVKHERM